MNIENVKSDTSKLSILDVRRCAVEWWCNLDYKTKKKITDTNKGILIKGIERTWQSLTGREIEKLYKIQKRS